MKNHLYLLLAAMLLVQVVNGQVTNNVELPTSINTTGNAPDASAILDVQSTTHGMLVPRMTTAQRTNINSPASGLLVFDTSTGGFWYYNGLSWQSLSGGSGTSHWDEDTFNGGIFYNNGNVAINHVETDPQADLYVYKTNTGASESGIFVRRQSSYTAFDGGSAWSNAGIDAAIKGYTQTGNTYSTAVYGSSYLDFNSSASVVGAHAGGATYGALGYKDASGNIHAGYFQGNVRFMDKAVINGTISNHADLYIEQSEYGALKSGLYVRNTTLSGINGTGWMPSGVCAAIRGYSNTGNSYSTSIYGGSALTHNNSASVLGTHAGGATFGALGFKDGSGNLYAGYFEGDVNISNKAAINSGSVNPDADLYIEQTEYGEGKSAIKAYRASSLNAGTSWGVDDADAVIHSESYAGEQYNTALYGANDLTNAHNAGVVGYEIGGASYGALAYRDELNGIYAGYFNGDVNVDGNLKLDDGTQAAGRVLTSDANGQASWQAVPSDGHWQEDANGIYRLDGNVGIGTEGTPPNSTIHVNQLQSGAGMSGLAVQRDPLTSGGTDWSDAGVDAAIKGTSLSESHFSTAVYGSSSLTNNTTAGVVGASNDGSIYGILGYHHNNLSQPLAGFFKGRVTIDGDELGLYVDRDVSGPSTNSLWVHRQGNSDNSMAGTNWDYLTSDAGIFVSSIQGNSYSSAIYAFSGFNHNNSAAIWGGDGLGNTFGALGYRDGIGDLYAGYFDGDIKVNTGALSIKQFYSNSALIFESPTNSNNWNLALNSTNNDFYFYYNGVHKSTIANFDGAYTQASDRTLKTNIEYLDGVLPKITQLKPAKYHYKSSTDAPQKSHGFIAQEVQAIFPELVRKSDDGTLALAYDDFAVLAVQAIKEQQAEIDELKVNQQSNVELEQTLNQLKAENVALEQRLAKLEALLTNSTK